MPERVTGYILLIVGIILILYACFSVVSVFTGSSQPFNLFTFSGISISPSQLTGGAIPSELLSQLTAGPQTTTTPPIISAEMINKPANLFAYLFLMGFLVSVGYKLASLGIQLIRPMVIKVKGEEPAK